MSKLDAMNKRVRERSNNNKEKEINKKAHEELFQNGSEDNSENTSVNTSGDTNENVNLSDIADNIASSRKKEKVEKFEDKHSKQTYWVRHDVLEALNKIATNRGDKTRIVNQAITEYIINHQND